jgi:glycosyltransferase involved in cell wall biosynthesis
MRVLIVSGEDLAGGGHRAALRLHQALRGIGVESFMAVRKKHSSDPYVHRMTASELGWPPIGRGYMDQLPELLRLHQDQPVSLGLQSARLDRLVERFAPDVVNFHWVNGGIASIRSSGRLQIPMVWTLHDMWAFTGGCHYAGDCQQYRQACASCPKIRPFMGAPHLSAWVHRRKQRHWSSRKIIAITPSRWMQQLALNSSLFASAAVTHIRNCVDPQVFSPAGRETNRQLLGLAPDRFAILFIGAHQKRKGADIIPEIVDALRRSRNGSAYKFLFLGGLPPALKPSQDVTLLPPSHAEAVVAGYCAAADLYVLPSFEDNLPNTISEALSCGCPVAAFPTGGIPEMVQDGKNGAISTDQTVASLIKAIQSCVDKPLGPRQKIAEDARVDYDPASIAAAHELLFRQLM